MEYTEEVFKDVNSGRLCRKIDKVKIMTDSGMTPSVLTVDIYGEKIAIPNEMFEKRYKLHDPGEKIS